MQINKYIFLTLLFAIFINKKIICSELIEIDGTNIENAYELLFLIIPISNINPGDNINIEEPKNNIISIDNIVYIPLFKILLQIKEIGYFYRAVCQAMPPKNILHFSHTWCMKHPSSPG